MVSLEKRDTKKVDIHNGGRITLKKTIEFNKVFVQDREYEKFTTSKFPDKKMVILSCMDTRLTELLPHALNLKNGDAKIIKNAGALITHPFGSIMRSIIVAIYELNAEKVCVIGHNGCGMGNMNPKKTIDKMIARGISEETVTTLEYAGINLSKWLSGFEHVTDSVKESVKIIKNHPLIPDDIIVYGLVIDSDTGELQVVVDHDEDI
jgi:carbonic anhydrase